MASLHKHCETPSDALLNSLEVRLPFSALSPFWVAAERHGIHIRTDEDAHEMALCAIAEHLIEMSNGRDSEAQVMACWMSDDSLQFVAVVVAESIVSHVVSRGPDWPLSKLWLAAA